MSNQTTNAAKTTTNARTPSPTSLPRDILVEEWRLYMRDGGSWMRSKWSIAAEGYDKESAFKKLVGINVLEQFPEESRKTFYVFRETTHTVVTED